jgi:hypothetical protein
MSIEKREQSIIQSINELKLKCLPAVVKNYKYGFANWSTAETHLKKKFGSSNDLSSNIDKLKTKITMIDNAADYLIDRIKYYKNYVDRNKVENFDKTDKRLQKLNETFTKYQEEAHILVNRITNIESKKQIVNVTKSNRELLITIAGLNLDIKTSSNKSTQAEKSDPIPTKAESFHSDPNIEFMQAQAFRIIYNALYEGQSSFFKSKASHCLAEKLTAKDIISYVNLNPNSRSAFAWSLAKSEANYLNPYYSNTFLFEQVHNYSYKHSSNFFSLFKQSKNFPNGYENENTQALIEKADDDSRTGMIRKALR